MLDALPPMARLLLTYAGWFILPNWVTNIAVVFYYRLRILFKPNYQPPARGSPEAANVWRYSYAFVMMSYLTITTLYSFATMPLNFYEILDVAPDADELTIKGAYKKFARKYHPDRAGASSAALFMEVRKVYEALSNPIKRLAYDRFGSQAMDWTDCATTREYIKHGLIASSGFYIGTVGFLLIWSIFSAGNLGTYWRNLLLATLLFAELHLIINGSTEALSFLKNIPVFRYRVPYQYILFLHQFYMSLSIAISRVLPVLLPSSRISPAMQDETMQVLKPLVDKLVFLAFNADREVSRMLAAEIRAMHGSSALPTSMDVFGVTNEPAFVPSDETITTLSAEMENLIIDKQLQNHPVLKGYWEAALQKRREDIKEHDLSNAPLPSPPRSLSPSRDTSGTIEATLNRLPSTRELPSPRPSPPRQLAGQQSSSSPGYIRGRSMSC
ncbi:hypothetical protein M422DRAFT_244587 [Sphaerobolus stellatus SS14]|nr:hypothetical protein M422DRAFT_244587 [Sphaerobolus stellatus SS14]